MKEKFRFALSFVFLISTVLVAQGTDLRSSPGAEKLHPALLAKIETIERSRALQTTTHTPQMYRIIVSLKHAPTPHGEIPDLAQMQPRIQALQETVLRAHQRGTLHLLYRYKSLYGFSAMADRDAILDLIQLGSVEVIEELPILQKMDIESQELTYTHIVHQAPYTGAGITIAIIDDGIDAAHEAFGGSAAWPNDKILGGYDFADNDADPRIDCPTQHHGTAVAGIAAGHGGGIIGSAPHANLVFLKIQSANWCGQNGLDGDLVAAIDWAVSHRNTYNIGVISMSLGGGSFSDPAICDGYTAFRNAVSAAHDAGIAVLAASGNNGYTSAISFPACLSDVMSVGAVYDSDIRSQGYIPACSLDLTAPDQVPCYSNSADILDILAPSDCATTAWVGGGTYGCFSGTSAATPFAAGITATLIEAAKQSLDSTKVRDLLTSSGEPILDGKNNLTKPRIDALATLTQLLPDWRIRSSLYTYKSFESSNLPGHFFQRKNTSGHLSPILSTSDPQDATFKLVPGLAGNLPDCISFESYTVPGAFLRHVDGFLQLDQWESDTSFTESATFCVQDGLANAAQVSFAAYTDPDHYVRHQDGRLRLLVNDGSDTFQEAATFIIAEARVVTRGDRFGTTVAACDFNGDDIPDLAIGVPDEDVGTVQDAGSVNVLYGDANGLQAASEIGGLPDQSWHQNRANLAGRSEAGDRFGRALATGDFNHDDYCDLAIGIPGEDIGAIGNAGAVTVLYGSGHGLQAANAQTWHQNSSGIYGSAEMGDIFGNTLATGDFNHDGYMDLVIGVPGEDVGVIADAGTVIVLYGTADGLQTTDEQTWHQNRADIYGNAEVGDGFGSSLATGDFNQDQYVDLAIGVPGEDVGTIQDAGTVVVLYGTTDGLQTASPADQTWHQNKAGLIGAAKVDDAFGSALAAGDFNQDGHTDLAIGVPGKKVAALGDSGTVTVLYGTEAGLGTANDQFWHQNRSGVYGIAEAGDRFGGSLSVGDFNGDNYADLAIGVPGEDVGTIQDAGSVNVLYGSGDGLQVTAPQDQSWSQHTHNVRGIAETGDGFGQALTTGDFNQDGYADLVIGIPGEDIDTLQNAGTVQILHGSAANLQAASPNDQVWGQNSPDVEGIAE